MVRPAGEGPTQADPDQVQHADPRKRRLVHRIAGALIVALVLGTGLAALVRAASGAADVDPGTFGVPVGQAGCAPTVTDPVFDRGVRVGPGTSQPDVTHVDYPTVPPSSGKSFAVPLFPNLPFYDENAGPQVEQLVLNLEHGYTVVWYDPALPVGQRNELDGLVNRLRLSDPKIIAAPWDTSRGRFPGGAGIAMVHWGADHGYRQFCQRVSGQALQAFLAAHPTSDSPDPGGA
jgi:hypothetical protein